MIIWSYKSASWQCTGIYMLWEVVISTCWECMQIAKLFCHTQLEGSLSRLARRINLTRYTLKTPLYFEPNFMSSLNIRFLSFIQLPVSLSGLNYCFIWKIMYLHVVYIYMRQSWKQQGCMHKTCLYFVQLMPCLLLFTFWDCWPCRS